MFQLLNDPRVLLGVALGFVVGAVIFFVISLISAMFPRPDKKRIEHKAVLLEKLKAAGYTVYMPFVMETQLVLRDSLSSDERQILGLDQMLIFDSHGQPVTRLIPLVTNSEQEASYRRGQFKIVNGGKQN